jgi:hypothetical protein
MSTDEIYVLMYVSCGLLLTGIAMLLFWYIG